MHITTKPVQFSFNNTMYQVDGITMDSPHGAALSNIFVGFPEERLFKVTNKSLFYKRHILDAFGVFFFKVREHTLFPYNQPTPTNIDLHLRIWECQQPSIFYVLVERTNLSIQMSICRKLTFTGSYSRKGLFAHVEAWLISSRYWSPGHSWSVPKLNFTTNTNTSRWLS